MASRNSFSFIDGWESLISNIRNFYKCLLRIFLNQFITFSVFFHWFTFISSYNFFFIFCNMCLFVLPISFFAGFSNLGRFKKFSLWSFKVMKLLPVPVISILSIMFASLACSIHSSFIFVAVCLSVLFFDVTAFCKRF